MTLSPTRRCTSRLNPLPLSTPLGVLVTPCAHPSPMVSFDSQKTYLACFHAVRGFTRDYRPIQIAADPPIYRVKTYCRRLNAADATRM